MVFLSLAKRALQYVTQSGHRIHLTTPSSSYDQGQAGTQPHWVAAAKLGNALQASRVVPVLHAAADRERRLAEVTAVARQQLDLGVSEASVLAAAASREQQLQPAAQEQLQQVVKWTQEVAQQNQLLQKAMLQQQKQLTHHQVNTSAYAVYYVVPRPYCCQILAVRACVIWKDRS